MDCGLTAVCCALYICDTHWIGPLPPQNAVTSAPADAGLNSDN